MPEGYKVAYLPSLGQVKVRLTARSEDVDLNEIEKYKEELKDALGDYVYGFEKTTIEEALLKLYVEKGKTLATAESCTGGMIAAAITDVAGSSDVFDRGFVTYSNAAKSEMLGVPADLIEAHGAVSEPVAEAMAEGALSRSNATVAVAVTGVAGPGASEHKPEGRVCFGLAQAGQETKTETRDFGALGRTAVRRVTVEHALALLQAAIS